MPLLSFQQRVRAWAVACFGAEIAYSCMGVFGRNHHIISLAVREITK